MDAFSQGNQKSHKHACMHQSFTMVVLLRIQTMPPSCKKSPAATVSKPGTTVSSCGCESAEFVSRVP